MRSKKFTSIFEEFLKGHPEFQEAFEIARRNSRGRGRRPHGRVWIIGGFVYRPIIKALYGEISEPKQTDIDFLIERKPKKGDLYLPEDWNPKITDYGNLYLEKGNTRIDLNYLFSFRSIIARKLQPEFGHFFTGTPMDIQAIAYDLTDKIAGVRGKRGIESIKTKIVRVNNLEEAQFESQKRIPPISIEDLVKEKATELGFGYDLSNLVDPPKNPPNDDKLSLDVYFKAAEDIGIVITPEQIRKELEKGTLKKIIKRKYGRTEKDKVKD